MQSIKLFHTLVISGAMLAGGCAGGSGGSSQTGSNDSSVGKSDSRTVAKQTFCSPKDVKVCKDGAPREGIECCWNTNC